MADSQVVVGAAANNARLANQPTGAVGLAIATTQYVDDNVPTFAKEEFEGSTQGTGGTFTLAATPVANSEQVFLNGVMQRDGGEDYTLTGAEIDFVTTIANDDVIIVYYRS